MSHSQPNISPLLKQVSERFKEPLDTIDLLKAMEVIDQKPPFPRIVALGDESASPGSVIGRLIGLNLPSDLGVTIVLTFKRTDDDSVSSNILLGFKYEGSYSQKHVCEHLLASEIEEVVKPIPEDKRSGLKINLTVNQHLQLYDLTIVILPEIRTHLDDFIEERKQFELFDRYIDEHINYGCLFLNVVACSSNFKSCLSRKVLEHHVCGNYIITIFSKLDLSCNYLVTKLTSKEFNSPPFGYFFLDECGSLLSTVDKEYIGFDVISENIVTALLSILFSPSCPLVQGIEARLKDSADQIKQLQKSFKSVSDALPEVFSIQFSATRYLYDLFIGQYYCGKYRKENHMLAAFNIAKKFKMFRTNLLDLKLDKYRPFLENEIELLNSGGCSLHPILMSRQLSYASNTIDVFLSNIMYYIKEVVVKVFLDCAENKLQFHRPLKEMCGVLVEGLRESYTKKVEEMLELERKSWFTCNDDYDRKLNEMWSVKLELGDGKEFTSVEGLGEHIRVDHLKKYRVYDIKRAFELRKWLVVYWEVVVNRFVDYCALNLQSSIDEMINGIPRLIVENVVARIKDEGKLPNVDRIVTMKKANLERRIEDLNEVKKDIKKWQVDRRNSYRYLFDGGFGYRNRIF